MDGVWSGATREATQGGVSAVPRPEPLWEIRPGGWKPPGWLALSVYAVACLLGTMAALAGWWVPQPEALRAPGLLPERLPLWLPLIGGTLLVEALRSLRWTGRRYRVFPEHVEGRRLLPPWPRRTALEEVTLLTFPGLPPERSQELADALHEERAPRGEFRYAGTRQGALASLVLVGLLPAGVALTYPGHLEAHARYEARVEGVLAAVSAADGVYRPWGGLELGAPLESAALVFEGDFLSQQTLLTGSTTLPFSFAGAWRSFQGGPDRLAFRVQHAAPELPSSPEAGQREAQRFAKRRAEKDLGVALRFRQGCAGWLPWARLPPLTIEVEAPSRGARVYLEYLRAELKARGIPTLVEGGS